MYKCLMNIIMLCKLLEYLVPWTSLSPWHYNVCIILFLAVFIQQFILEFFLCQSTKFLLFLTVEEYGENILYLDNSLSYCYKKCWSKHLITKWRLMISFEFNRSTKLPDNVVIPIYRTSNSTWISIFHTFAKNWDDRNFNFLIIWCVKMVLFKNIWYIKYLQKIVQTLRIQWIITK